MGRNRANSYNGQKINLANFAGAGGAEAIFADDVTTALAADPELNPTPDGAPTSVTKKGELKGFKDTSGGFNKFMRNLYGQPSTADTLTAQLALGRDTTAQQLAGNLALGAQGNEARLRELTTKAKLDSENADRVFNNNLTLGGVAASDARSLALDNQQHQEKLEQIRNSNASKIEKARSVNALLASKQANEQALALKLGVRVEDLAQVAASGVSALNAENTARATTGNITTARGIPYVAALDDPNSPQAQAALMGQMMPDALARGNAMRANTLSVGPGEASFTREFGGGVWPTTATFGRVAADKNPMTGLPLPGTGTEPRQVEDVSNSARAKMSGGGYGSEPYRRLGSEPLDLRRPSSPLVGATTAAPMTPGMFDFTHITEALATPGNQNVPYTGSMSPYGLGTYQKKQPSATPGTSAPEKTSAKKQLIVDVLNQILR